MAYKTFIKSIGSTKQAGVGFLPLPQELTPSNPSSRFVDIIQNGLNCQVQGIVGDATLLQPGDIIGVVTDDAVYDTQGAVVTVYDATAILTDIPFTSLAGAGTITFISRP